MSAFERTDDRASPSSAISRRTLVKAGLGAVATPAVLNVIPANAQSRAIKIGHVSPKTGPLAGFGEADGFILEQVNGILAKGLVSGGKTYPVQIISKDSQSSGNRAAEVASELILGDKVDLIVASATWATRSRTTVKACSGSRGFSSLSESSCVPRSKSFASTCTEKSVPAFSSAPS